MSWKPPTTEAEFRAECALAHYHDQHLPVDDDIAQYRAGHIHPETLIRRLQDAYDKANPPSLWSWVRWRLK